jgi:hypothetical protein
MRGRLSVVFLVAAGFVTGCNAILGPGAVDANWRVVEQGRFTFYVRPGSFAEQHVVTLADVLEEQYDTTVRRLELRYDGRLSLFLFDSGADAGLSNEMGDGNHSGVAYPDTASVRVSVVPPLDANLFALLSHEINHVIIRSGLGRPGTSFINEGLASAVLSERFHALGPSFYHSWAGARRGQLPRLADLVDDEKWETVQQATAYNASASFLAYVIETYGASAIREVYYSSSQDFARAFEAAVGRPLPAAEAEWLTFCEEKGR